MGASTLIQRQGVMGALRKTQLMLRTPEEMLLTKNSEEFKQQRLTYICLFLVIRYDSTFHTLDELHKVADLGQG
jgi:hypothetical protein